MPQSSHDSTLKLGTRGSLLAQTQSMLVAHDLERAHPGLRVELVTIKTSGDRITDKPLHAFGGKGLFTKELEQALLDGAIDFAVHSFKDVPVTQPLVDTTDLIVAAVPEREDARDVFVTRDGRLNFLDLPPGIRVGTGSLRRRSQILARWPKAVVQPIRGNIDTRMRKLQAGEYDAVVLAMAGVRRTKLFDPEKMEPIDAEHLLPAPGQGALALQCRRDDARAIGLLEALNDAATARCVAAERRVVEALHGDCHSPIAAFARIREGTMTLRAAVGARDGLPPVVRADASAPVDDAESAVGSVLRALGASGAASLLAGDAT